MEIVRVVPVSLALCPYVCLVSLVYNSTIREDHLGIIE